MNVGASLGHICVSGNRSENLGRVGTHIFFIIFFFWKNIYNFIHFKIHKFIFFSRKPEKILGFTSKFR